MRPHPADYLLGLCVVGAFALAGFDRIDPALLSSVVGGVLGYVARSARKPGADK